MKSNNLIDRVLQGATASSVVESLADMMSLNNGDNLIVRKRIWGNSPGVKVNVLAVRDDGLKIFHNYGADEISFDDASEFFDLA